ncbi:MAG TPA: radical SAM protein [Planctomycetota bacterium]|nr:radical SAM protein [Planctomycetota bacterium]
MRVIYEPSGRAREYAELATNPYAGCVHGCRYCYAPLAMRKHRAEFHAGARARPKFLEQIREDARELAGDRREVLFSFSCDPYQEIERTEQLTRQSLGILADHAVGTIVLTKAPGLAIERDLDVLARARTKFGVTLVSLEERFLREWEPRADSIEVRLVALRLARAAGLRTWVSLEPVVSPVAAYDVLREVSRIGVDEVRIGKLNHDKEREDRVDWGEFAHEAVKICQAAKMHFYLKEDLRKWL